MIMGIEALGYIGVRSKRAGDWASYGENFLGLQRIDKSRSTLAFRMDDRKQRLVVDADGGQGIGFFGWAGADAAALKAVAARTAAGAWVFWAGRPRPPPRRPLGRRAASRPPPGFRASPARSPASATS